MNKLKSLVTASLMLMCAQLWAASTLDCGSYVLRYRVAASQELSDKLAEMLGIEAQPNRGVINLILLKKRSNEVIQGDVRVFISRGSGIISPLLVKSLQSDESNHFYTAEFDFEPGEKLDFKLYISTLGERPQSLSISKTLQ